MRGAPSLPWELRVGVPEEFFRDPGLLVKEGWGRPRANMSGLASPAPCQCLSSPNACATQNAHATWARAQMKTHSVNTHGWVYSLTHQVHTPRGGTQRPNPDLPGPPPGGAPSPSLATAIRIQCGPAIPLLDLPGPARLSPLAPGILPLTALPLLTS